MADVQIIQVSKSQRSTMVLERIGAPLPPTGGECSQKNTNWWFPGHAQTRDDMQNTQQAIEMCRKCSIRKECLEYAMNWEAFGIWGGFTEKQRDAIRRTSGIRSNIALRNQSRSKIGADMMVEHKDLIWLKKKGFINAAA